MTFYYMWNKIELNICQVMPYYMQWTMIYCGIQKKNTWTVVNHDSWTDMSILPELAVHYNDLEGRLVNGM